MSTHFLAGDCVVMWSVRLLINNLCNKEYTALADKVSLFDNQ